MTDTRNTVSWNLHMRTLQNSVEGEFIFFMIGASARIGEIPLREYRFLEVIHCN